MKRTDIKLTHEEAVKLAKDLKRAIDESRHHTPGFQARLIDRDLFIYVASPVLPPKERPKCTYCKGKGGYATGHHVQGDSYGPEFVATGFSTCPHCLGSGFEPEPIELNKDNE
jgi:hypothetical protein